MTILFSVRGNSRTLRHVNGYHTYSLINADGERTWCKSHFKTQKGIEYLPDADSAELIGRDHESHGRDLLDSIEAGDFSPWNFRIQVMTQEQAEDFPWNPFDLTKVWPHAAFPPIDVGVLELKGRTQGTGLWACRSAIASSRSTTAS